ncbi:MAG: hypothetical protein J7L96_06195 [Bacteroidales bacterium]|nr:hypothetical protein [Bacteroidales bacterium]
MPYRRLPTTDAARMRALQAAIERTNQLELTQLAFTTRYIHPLRNFHQQLQTHKFQQEQSWEQVVNQNKDHQKKVQKARLYINHFIQVLNMIIARNEFPAETRRLYGLDVSSNRVPALQSEKDLIKWGQLLIDGETKRIRMGGAPIMNPSMGKVRVWYERFKESHFSQQTANKSYQRSTHQLGDLRRKIDALLQAVWNEVEDFFINLPDDERRAKCSEYGVVYVFRKNEIKS